MAKVNGPLMSMDASGGFAGALVFGKWKGRNVVRQLVIPANPHVQTQEDARNLVRAAGIAQHFANLEDDLKAGETLTDKARLIAAAPASQAWNGFLVKSMIGKGDITADAAAAAWAALTGGQKTAWDDAADALTPPITPAYQTTVLGIATTPLTSGNVFFLYEYGLMAALGDAEPGVAPPVYA